jgi:ERCC4-type nuclease
MEIVIDTREQSPWHFPEWAASARIGTLRTGDYALAGDDGFAVERKSLDDFCGTVATGWDRFVREIERMIGWPARVVIVEGSFSSLVFGPDGTPPRHNHWRVGPGFAIKRIAQLSMMGVSVLFAETPEYGAALCLAILRERNDFLEREKMMNEIAKAGA